MSPAAGAPAGSSGASSGGPRGSGSVPGSRSRSGSGPGGGGAGGLAGVVGAATGMLALGAGIGLAVERLLVGRRRTPDPDLDAPLGSLRGRPEVVRTDDGIELYAEVDELGPAGAAPARRPARSRRARTARPTSSTGPVPTLVFCHGYSLNLDCWHFQRQALRGLARLVFYDQRSHGRSGRAPADSCTVERLGDDLAHVVERLAPDGPVVLVGHSMGGMSVLAFANRHRQLFADRVVAAALIGTSAGDLHNVNLGVPGPIGRLVPRLVPPFFAALTRAPDLVEQSRRAGSDIGYLLTKRYSFGSKVPAARVEFVTEMLSATPIEVVADFYPAFARHDEYAALPVLETVETLVMCGTQDLVVPASHGREIAARLPMADFVELDHCGHMIAIEYPEVVDEHLAALVARGVPGWPGSVAGQHAGGPADPAGPGGRAARPGQSARSGGSGRAGRVDPGVRPGRQRKERT